MKTPDYGFIIVESFKPTDTSGRHGLVHIRPIAGQEPFKTTMFVECSKELMNDYPVGTKFKIKAKITNREGGTPFIYSHYSWSYEIIED
jgi:hypothetical protein